MSDDYVTIRPVQPLRNVNRLTPTDRDKEKGGKNFYEQPEKDNAEEPYRQAPPDETGAKLPDNSSDGHSIDIKA